MALIVEDGTVVAGAESYLSVADADTYHTARGNDGWTGDEAAKEAALRNATDYLVQRHRMNWFGNRRTTTQTLDWPRSGLFDVAVDEVPPEVRHATAEMALVALTTDLNAPLERGGQVRREREKVGPIESETEYADGALGRTRYPAVDGILAPFLMRRGRLVRV